MQTLPISRKGLILKSFQKKTETKQIYFNNRIDFKKVIAYSLDINKPVNGRSNILAA